MPNDYRTLFGLLFSVMCAWNGKGQANQASPTNPEAAATGTNPGFAVNTMNREEVRIFFNTVFSASENVPIEWTGNTRTGNPGMTSQAFRDAVALRINYFRAMAGVPADVNLNDEWNRKAQAAALMMSANNQLDHFPPATWKFYTAEGAEAARNSNLCLGTTGPSAIAGFMSDAGENNESVGHRRWILYPQTKMMGTGNVPVMGTNPATSALWVFDQKINDRLTTRDTFVAWPPKGYCPYEMVYPRWSFSYPVADFTASTVSMEREGQDVPLRVEPVSVGFGENTLVWVPDELADAVNNSFASAPRPLSDSVTTVTIRDVSINGALQDFTYSVVVIDPKTHGADTVFPTISGRSELRVNEGALFVWNLVPVATGYEWRVVRRMPLTSVEVADSWSGNTQIGKAPAVSVGVSVTFSGDGGFIGTDAPPGPIGFPNDTPGLNEITHHLTHRDSLVDQFLTLKQTILPRAGSILRFGSRLGRASENQVATVEVSTDGGSSWKELFRQAGDSGPGETSSALRAVDLSPFADRMLTVRFAYRYTGGVAYTGEIETGWYINGISVTGAEQLISLTSALTSEAKFTYIPTIAGDFIVQVRPRFYQRFFGEWGPIKRVSVTGTSFTLTAPSRSLDGFTFTLNGEVGHTFIIETSTNLRDWSALRPIFTTSTTTPILDAKTGTVNEQARFYRAVRSP